MRARAGAGNKVPAVVKAVAVLDDLARSGDAGSISGMARRIEAPKSSVADICGTLSRLGLLSRERDGRFLLGRHIVELARGLVGGRRLIEIFPEACNEAPELRDETLTLSILDGADIVIVAVHHGRATLPVTARIGLRLPAWATASGRCFLGALPHAAVAEILASGSATATGVSGTLPSAGRLVADLASQRARGFYVDEQSTADGMTSFGAPIAGESADQVVAAVAIAARTDALSQARSAALGASALAMAAACKRLDSSIDDT